MSAPRSLGIAIPNFWLAMILIAFFAINLGWFPAIGWVKFQDRPESSGSNTSCCPPSRSASGPPASMARQLRSGLMDTLDTNYVRTAWAKGSGTRRVVGKHGLKNAAIPAVTVLGLQLSTLLGGTVVIEQIFSIPGLGQYLLAAIHNYDIPVIQGVTVVFVLIFVIVNLIVDISYGYFNPRVRVVVIDDDLDPDAIHVTPPGSAPDASTPRRRRPAARSKWSAAVTSRHRRAARCAGSSARRPRWSRSCTSCCS